MKNTTLWIGLAVAAVLGAIIYSKSGKTTKAAPRPGGLTPEATAEGVNKALAEKTPLSTGVKQAIEWLKGKGWKMSNNQMVKA